MPDGWLMFRNQVAINIGARKWTTRMQHLQRIAAWAGASILLQALLLGTGAICYHGIDEGGGGVPI